MNEINYKAIDERNPPPIDDLSSYPGEDWGDRQSNSWTDADGGFQSAFSNRDAGPRPDATPLPADDEQRQGFKLKATPFLWRDPRSIPPRPWLYGHHLARRYVSATIAPGGMGKSTKTMTDAVALASGRKLLHDKPRGPLRVWIWNGEDDQEELERRMIAIFMHFDIAPDDVGDRLFLDNGRDTVIRVAEVSKGSIEIATPVVDALEAEIKARNIDVLIIDPFVSVHSTPENDNGAMDRVVKTFAAIANRTNCAIELVHHSRKLNGAEADIDSARGGSAIAGAVRAARVLNPMTMEVAKELGIPSNERKSYVRVDGAKANLAPLGAAKWFKLVSVFLGNGTDDDPEDSVAVSEPWTPPDVMDDVTGEDLLKAQRAVDGRDLKSSSQATEWAGYAIGDAIGIDARSEPGKTKIKRCLKTWISTEMLVEREIFDDRNRRPVKVIVVGNWACAQ
ncbi:AAA family ATPase [Phyllobacterium myrsinacearum]|uniref:Recombinase RecA n=1 Tax=Phyllobacterium myrsinacearum TaxID=28101 RepID=A0A839EGI2_9HYPH|nr:helicase RepA family protein [Phyllobacterium myrsinacearum]MBA8877869.1 hypothetical protein [Phyllobacterium myrsinacearum]